MVPGKQSKIEIQNLFYVRIIYVHNCNSVPYIIFEDFLRYGGVKIIILIKALAVIVFTWIIERIIAQCYV